MQTSTRTVRESHSFATAVVSSTMRSGERVRCRRDLLAIVDGDALPETIQTRILVDFESRHGVHLSRPPEIF